MDDNQTNDKDLRQELPPAQEAEVQARFPIYEDGDSPTAIVKRRFQDVARQLILLRDKATTPHAGRSASVALTELETASMYAVKALHQG